MLLALSSNALLAMTLGLGLDLDSVCSTLEESQSQWLMATLYPYDYWKERYEKDKGQTTDNPHIIAARIIDTGVDITHVEVNAVLANQGIKITEGELASLVAIEYKEYELDSLEAISSMFPREGNV